MSFPKRLAPGAHGPPSKGNSWVRAESSTIDELAVSAFQFASALAACFRLLAVSSDYSAEKQSYRRSSSESLPLSARFVIGI